MKRITNLVKRTNSSNADTTAQDGPEADAARGVRLFCESAGQNNSGEEVLHLPIIVDAAESSPAAAREAAMVIRRFLSRENVMRAYTQYNAVMLIRILADHPGPTFTRNLDAKFVSTVKELLREGRDMAVQQILRETLDTFESTRKEDETLQPLIQMWTAEKAKWAKKAGYNIGSTVSNGSPSSGPNGSFPPPPPPPHTRAGGSSRHGFGAAAQGGLPSPAELASRIEEARTSSKLLTQLVQSTPPVEVPGNELIREFAERCQTATHSIQGYITADSPAPDEDTLLTLIETNDGLSAALSRHQHALLQGRRQAKTTAAPEAPMVDVDGGAVTDAGPLPQPSAVQRNDSGLNDGNGSRTSGPGKTAAEESGPVRARPRSPPPKLSLPLLPSREASSQSNISKATANPGQTGPSKTGAAPLSRPSQAPAASTPPVTNASQLVSPLDDPFDDRYGTNSLLAGSTTFTGRNSDYALGSPTYPPPDGLSSHKEASNTSNTAAPASNAGRGAGGAGSNGGGGRGSGGALAPGASSLSSGSKPAAPPPRAHGGMTTAYAQVGRANGPEAQEESEPDSPARVRTYRF